MMCIVIISLMMAQKWCHN